MRAHLVLVACLGGLLACEGGAGADGGSAPRAQQDPIAKVERSEGAKGEAVRGPLAQKPPLRDFAGDAAAFVATVEELGAVHARLGEDCPALADELKAFHGQHGAKLAAEDPALHAHIDGDETLRERTREALESVMSASMGCRADPRFSAAQAELSGAAEGEFGRPQVP